MASDMKTWTVEQVRRRAERLRAEADVARSHPGLLNRRDVVDSFMADASMLDAFADMLATRPRQPRVYL